MILCNSCLYQFDIRHCCPPDFGEVAQCNGYVDKKDFYKHLDFLMKQMPTKRKEIFFMAYLEGIKAKEIAKQFQMPIRTVESHLYLAVKFLKKNMTRSHFLP